MNIFILRTFVCLFALISIPSHAHELGAHVHGIATLQIAIDEKTLTLNFSSPLDNLLGFEHVPHNEKEKAVVRAMVDALQKANILFIPNAAGQCELQSVNLDSPIIAKKLGAETEKQHEEEAGHADLDGEFVFKCAQAEKLNGLQVNLFKRFQNLHQIKVETVSLRGQSASTLTPDKSFAAW